MILCAIDWMAWAAWIGAASTFGLLIAAVLGFFVWKSQFKKQRDHELAVRILRTISDSYVELDDMRGPTGIISDHDVALDAPEFNDSNMDLTYRVMKARYRARKMHLIAVVKDRTTFLNEGLVIWDGEYGETLADKINELAEMESRVSREVAIYLDGLSLRAEGDIDRPDLDILYSPADAEAEDLFADRYQTKIEVIRKHLAPKIRME